LAEGAGVDAMRHLEQVVLAISARDKAPVVVCFDDFDTSIASRRAGTEYTVNSQLLESYFQFTADSGGFKTSCGSLAALIMTGNDFTDMRASLLRPGRAEFYTHAVSFDEKTVIVTAMFAGADDKVIKTLVKAHAHEPVAFFHDLKTLLLNEDLDALYRQHGLNIAAINEAMAARDGNIDMTRIKTLAAQAATAKAGSFLNFGRV
ncbi:MAG: hypothetical protein ABL897_04330, partial [Hyphomicrobium sp.]